MYRWFPLFAVITGLLVSGLGLWMSSAQVASVQGDFRNQLQLQPVELPWRFNDQRRHNRLVVDFYHGYFSPQVWQIIPDDQLTRIKLNGHTLSLKDVPTEKLRDFTRGFHLNLSEHLKVGKNQLEIQFHNNFGPGGIDIQPVWEFWRYALIYLGIIAILLGLSAWFRLKLSQQWLLALALIPIFLYWSGTPWLVRAHDVSGGGGHYDYVEYIATKNALPKATDGWVYYHPPAYYLAGALVWKTAKTLGLPVHESLQLFAILLWLVFLISGLATINLFTRHKPGARTVASLALVFWPAGILHSPAIGNDAALYAVAGLATWVMCRWWFTGRRLHLFWLAALCGLALLIKSNGIVLVAAAGLLLLLRFFLKRSGRAFMDGVYFGLIAGVSLAASMAVRVYYYIKGETASWLISNVGSLNSGLRVPADIKAFLPLDVPTFLAHPYMSTYDSITGRENFWNFLLRSSITGEFSFDNPLLTKIAYAMGALLLLLFFCLAVGLPRLWRTRRARLYRYLPLLFLGIIWLGSLIVLRIQVPFSCSNDFRYVAPVLIPLIIFWVSQGRWPRWLLALLSLFSAAFYSTVGLVS